MTCVLLSNRAHCRLLLSPPDAHGAAEDAAARQVQGFIATELSIRGIERYEKIGRKYMLSAIATFESLGMVHSLVACLLDRRTRAFGIYAGLAWVGFIFFAAAWNKFHVNWRHFNAIYPVLCTLVLPGAIGLVRALRAPDRLAWKIGLLIVCIPFLGQLRASIAWSSTPRTWSCWTSPPTAWCPHPHRAPWPCRPGRATRS